MAEVVTYATCVEPAIKLRKSDGPQRGPEVLRAEAPTSPERTPAGKIDRTAPSTISARDMS